MRLPVPAVPGIEPSCGSWAASGPLPADVDIDGGRTSLQRAEIRLRDRRSDSTTRRIRCQRSGRRRIREAGTTRGEARETTRAARSRVVRRGSVRSGRVVPRSRDCHRVGAESGGSVERPFAGPSVVSAAEPVAADRTGRLPALVARGLEAPALDASRAHGRTDLRLHACRPCFRRVPCDRHGFQDTCPQTMRAACEGYRGRTGRSGAAASDLIDREDRVARSPRSCPDLGPGDPPRCRPGRRPKWPGAAAWHVRAAARDRTGRTPTASIWGAPSANRCFGFNTVWAGLGGGPGDPPSGADVSRPGI